MTLKGYYLKDLLEYKDCEIFCERGNIYRVSVIESSPLVTMSVQPYNKSEFTFEKLPSKNHGIIPYGCNYSLEYLSSSKQQSTIFFKLNYLAAIRTRWVLRKYLIQSKEMKTDVLKYVIGLIIGFIFALITQRFLN
ncbi:hypothetical protein [Muriicola sp. Z0-33]|uniref:hypothetical protein n=1 Tax=Muriicola sp. Z0-33 TaxID=2816957 RepID=UPI002237DF24|nr:hypothetical protein [Muriicola sp. Z0-33]MCW5514723.1 hypothetical protein [Muriicola sp. Z0-33]